MFSRTLILAGALAAALVPMSSMPARAADPADVAKIVGGIATLYIVGRAVSQARADNDDDDDDDRKRERREAEYRWQDDRDHGRRFREHDNRFDRGWRDGRGPRDDHGWRDGRGSKDDHRWRGDHGRKDGRGHWSGRGEGRYGAAPGARRMTLPAGCQTTMHVRHKGRQIVMGPGCLARAGHSWRDLPQQCRVAVRTRDGLREAYNSHCLQRAGYRIRR